MGWTHVNEDGRLRTIQVIDSPPVGNKPNSLELVHKILQRRVDNVVQLGLEQTADDPV